MENILLVDDQEENLYILEEMLAPLGYKIFKSENGKIAMDILENEKIDLVLSDVNMPVMDGLKLCKEIKENETLRNIPIVLLSGMKKELEDMVDGIDKGADDYMVKPVDRSLLVAKVRAMLRLRELNERLTETEVLKTFAATVMTAGDAIINPVAVITGNIERLQTEKDLDEGEIDEIYEVIAERAQKIDQIVRNFENISRPVKKIYGEDIEMIDLDKSEYKE